jgi:general secretion pathway protein H
MLAVLTIIALVMAVMPSIFAGLSASRLRAAADEMIGKLRMARSEAMHRSTTIELLVDPARRVYQVSTEAGVQSLPDVVERLDVAPAGLLGEDRLARLRFFPDGSATEGQIWLHHGNQSTGIAIDWLTGLARRNG